MVELYPWPECEAMPHCDLVIFARADRCDDYVLTAVDLDTLVFTDTDPMLVVFKQCGANAPPRRIVPVAELRAYKDGIQEVPAQLAQLDIDPATVTLDQGRACVFIWHLAAWEPRRDYPTYPLGIFEVHRPYVERVILREPACPTSYRGDTGFIVLDQRVQAAVILMSRRDERNEPVEGIPQARLGELLSQDPASGGVSFKERTVRDALAYRAVCREKHLHW